MLAQSPSEIIDIDALLDLYAATARLAIKDFEAGPAVVGERHYETACQFLEESGLINRIAPPPAQVGPRQLALFDDGRKAR